MASSRRKSLATLDAWGKQMVTVMERWQKSLLPKSSSEQRRKHAALIKYLRTQQHPTTLTSSSYVAIHETGRKLPNWCKLRADFLAVSRFKLCSSVSHLNKEEWISLQKLFSEKLALSFAADLKRIKSRSLLLLQLSRFSNSSSDLPI